MIANAIKINDHVFKTNANIVTINRNDIKVLKQLAAKNDLRRCRLCGHKSDQDELHEMIIAMQKDSLIQPHKHKGKIESYHMIEGEMDIVLFSEKGEIEEVVKMSSTISDERSIYYRLNCDQYHTLVLHSEMCVFHEVTKGPFLKEDTQYASFSPSFDQIKELADFLQTLRKKIS